VARPLTHIRQSNRTSGCGPACVAMAAGVTEAEAIIAMFGWDRRVSLWTSWKRLRRGLRAFGVEEDSEKTKIKGWREIPTLSVVAMGKGTSSKGSVAHWVIYDPESNLVYDPAKEAPVVPTSLRRKPLAYLRFTPPDGAPAPRQ